MNYAKTFLEENGFFEWKKNKKEFREKIKKSILEAEQGIYNLEYGKRNPKSMGKVLAIELGGTNLRLVLADFNKKIRILRSKESQFFRQDNYTPEKLFEELWEHMEDFLDREKTDDIAFIFSYPQKNEYVNGKIETTVIKMAKKIKIHGINGMNITEEFREFLKDKLGHTNIVVVNDATASALMLKYLEDFEGKNLGSKINLIIGTGYNIAYIVENKSNVKVVNTEAGTFPSFKYTIFDKEVNEAAGPEHIHHFESMLSGKWIPLIFKEIVNKMGIGANSVKDMESLIEFIGNDKEMNYIVDAITERGAYMVGTVLSEIVNHLGSDKAAILAEGSVFWNLDNYKDKILGVLMNNTNADIELVRRENSASVGCIYLLSQFLD